MSLIQTAIQAQFTPHQRVQIWNKFQTMPDEDRRRILAKIKLCMDLEAAEKCKDSFMAFVQRMWGLGVGEPFKEAPHHGTMIDAFQRVASGHLNRLIITLPPRSGKSELASWLLPAWYIGKYPSKKIIMASHTADIAVDFGRRVRNLVDTEEYRQVFPGVALSPDKIGRAHV